jgi:hypothetical protein
VTFLCREAQARQHTMKTFARERDKAEILRRLAHVRPDSVGRWGRMSAHEMVCHLTDSCRMALGQMSVSPAAGRLRRTIIRWMALYVPRRWPRGIQTRPEIEQGIGGTGPGEFAADLAELQTFLEALATRPVDFEWPVHPVFGRMSHRAWLRWAYLHADHHLRQFGV